MDIDRIERSVKLAKKAKRLLAKARLDSSECNVTDVIVTDVTPNEIVLKLSLDDNSSSALPRKRVIGFH